MDGFSKFLLGAMITYFPLLIVSLLTLDGHKNEMRTTDHRLNQMLTAHGKQASPCSFVNSLRIQLTSSLCFSQSVYKTCQTQCTELKVCRLIVYSKLHKICKFENYLTRNEVIMMSLPKAMENNGTSTEPNKIYIVQKILMKVFKNVT